MEAQKNKAFWIGCQTHSGSEGIYSAVFNSETGEITSVQLQGQSKEVSYLVKHPQQNILFSNKETGIYNTQGAIDVWTISNSVQLTHSQQINSEGEDPCFLCLSNDNQSIFVANYSSGSVAKFKIDNQAKLNLEKSSINPYPQQKTHSRQEKQHAHSILQFSDKFYITADLGSDLLVIYDSDLNLVDTCQMNEGSGPRHFVIINNNVILVVGELDQTLNVVQFDEQTGKFKLINSIKTILPDDQLLKQRPLDILCSHILLSNDRKFVYIANRTHDSITTFECQDDSYLSWKYKQNVPCGGSFPRHIEFSPDQEFILSSNQHGHSISILKRDLKTGELTLTKEKLEIKNPMFILFV